MADGYERLRIAILRFAAKDYILAIKKNNFAKMAKLEKFFLSEWGEQLSFDHGQFLIEYCKRIAKKK